MLFKGLRTDVTKGHRGGSDILRFIGPGLLVTVGFIDPGNWASNIAAGSQFGYALLWVVTLSTIMLIVLQHNAAHLGIATGLCLAEASTEYLPRWLSRLLLTTAFVACVATALAEVLGGAIALQILFNLPIKLGAFLVGVLAIIMLLTNSYQKIERWIIGIVSLVGLAFLIELLLAPVDWPEAVISWVKPSLPSGSAVIVMSILGAVVMPHNLFLHSEVIQSRRINEQGDTAIQQHLKHEFVDTLLSMGIGWAINSAMIIMAAATFFTVGTQVDDLAQAAATLAPIAGPAASIIFAIALLLAGISSSVTAGMAAGTVTAGMFGEPYDVRDKHSAWGIIIVFAAAIIAILFIEDSFQGLIWSQVLLSVQLPLTIFMQVYLTSSKRVMGVYANTKPTVLVLLIIGIVVTLLNMTLLITGA